jgi:hypothetical protein
MLIKNEILNLEHLVLTNPAEKPNPKPLLTGIPSV